MFGVFSCLQETAKIRRLRWALSAWVFLYFFFGGATIVVGLSGAINRAIMLSRVHRIWTNLNGNLLQLDKVLNWIFAKRDNWLKCRWSERQFCWLCRMLIIITRRRPTIPLGTRSPLAARTPMRPTFIPPPTSTTATRATTIRECECWDQVAEAFMETLTSFSAGKCVRCVIVVALPSDQSKVRCWTMRKPNSCSMWRARDV